MILAVRSDHIELQSICFKANPSPISLNLIATLPVDGIQGRSMFMNLSQHHQLIKGWLYRVFGGSNVLDACAGHLNDIDSWRGAGFANVLAIEKDEILYRRGLRAIEKWEKKSPSSSDGVKVSIKKCDLSVPVDLSNDLVHVPSLDAVFCNFAVHYFWDNPNDMAVFLRNLSPFIREGGRFVVTFLQGEAFDRTNLIEVYNSSGIVEFRACRPELTSRSVNVYVKSIGKSHKEGIIEIEELKSRFSTAGLDFAAYFPFEALGNLFPTSKYRLTAPEKEMSNLYAAAVFKKRSSFPILLRAHQKSNLFAAGLPPELEKGILAFLAVPDAVKCRLVSKLWRRALENDVLPERTKSSFFLRFSQAEMIRYNSETDSYWLDAATELSSAGVALYLRLGGPPIPPILEEDDDSSTSSFHCYRYRDDFSDFGF